MNARRIGLADDGAALLAASELLRCNQSEIGLLNTQLTLNNGGGHTKEAAEISLPLHVGLHSLRRNQFYAAAEPRICLNGNVSFSVRARSPTR